MKSNETAIHVENLDITETNHIVATIDKLEAGSSEKQEVKIRLSSLKGSIEHSLEIATAAHAAKKVDLSINVYGANGPAAAILVASGKPGSRIAQMGATFTLNSGDAYEEDVKAPDLDEDDKTVYQALSALTGKKKYILDAIIKGGAISAREAKKCGIIDSISEFKSKYLQQKPKGVKQSSPHQSAENTQPVPAFSSQENATPGENAVIEKRRGRRKTN